MKQHIMDSKIGFNGFCDIPLEGAGKNTTLGENVQTKHRIAYQVLLIYKEGNLYLYYIYSKKRITKLKKIGSSHFEVCNDTNPR